MNIQGLVTKRTNKLKSVELNDIFKSSDIVLFTETWTDEYSDVNVDDFDCYILHRTENKKSCKRNSGGIAVYIRHDYVSKDTLVYLSDDDIIWVKIEGKRLSFSSDLYICLIYVLPDDSSRQAMVETNIFDRLLESIACIENKSINECKMLILGDFNSRTSTNCDYVINDNNVHMHMLPDDYISDIELPRYSEDKGHVNNNGLLLLDLCKQSSLRILNGRFGNDKGVGHYTFVGSRGSSVVDYVLSSQNLLTHVSEFEVGDPNILSDHCLITFSSNFCNPSNEPSLVNNSYERLS